MCLLHRATTRIMDRDRCSGPIHKQLLAGLVLLAQDDILFAAPSLIQLAESGIAVAVWVCLSVLLPKQLLGHMLMLLSLPMKIGKVRHGQHGRAAAWWSAEQRSLKSVIIPLRSKRPLDLGGFGPLQIL